MTALNPVFSLVLAGATDGFLVVVSMAPGQQGLQAQAFPVAEAEAAQAFAVALGQTRQVYIESAIQRSSPPPGKRGTVAGAAQMSLVSLDFDGAWGVHAESRLPEQPEDLPLLLEAAGAPQPTLVLNTGGGLLGLWGLDRPLRLDGPHALERAKRISKGFQRRIREEAESRFGWKLDNTSDLCRLIRIPGTLNHKFLPPKQVEMVP